jgi:hypothetical protein
MEERMTRMKPASIVQLSVLTALALIVWTPNAQAYIDPTAAGAALQSLYMLFISALMFVALLPKKVAAFFAWVKGRLFPLKQSLPAPNQENQNG